MVTRSKGKSSGQKSRRERDVRYKEKHPEKSKASKRFSRIKGQVLKEFTKQHQDVMPKLLERPQEPTCSLLKGSNNRYWLLEEHLQLLAGRREKIYTWESANKILLEHYEALHDPRGGRGKGREKAPPSDCGCSQRAPLTRHAFDRNSEDGDEWDSFLLYNQALIQHYFEVQEWDTARENYERKLSLWEECKPSEDQILSEAHFRYRKKWRSIYSSSGDIQLPVRSKGAVDDRYPHPDFKSLPGRITAMAGELHGITDGTTECARLKQAIHEGWLWTRGTQEMDCNGMDLSHAGYYGSRGASKILTILNTHVKDLRPPEGTQSYLKLLQYVIVPEVAIRLIMEDNGVDYNQASVIWAESKGSGPVDDDGIYYSDSD